MTSSSSITLIAFMAAEHFGHVNLLGLNSPRVAAKRFFSLGR
jgi:hypothetical protein